MVSAACRLLLLAVLGNALELTPPSNQWVKPDQQNVTLICKTTEKVRSCSWTTPYGKSYPLQAGLVAEAGRLAHYVEGDQKDFECGILITQFEAQDSGRWKCNVGVVDNGEVTTATGLANITVATAPKSVMLDEPFNNEVANVTTGETYEVKCIATEARPAPVFKWMIDETPLEGKTMDEEVFVDQKISTFAQTLFYKPESHHANKTLQCIIDHVALANQDSIGVTILLEEEPMTSLPIRSLGAGGTAGIIVAIIITLLAVTIILFLVRRARRANQEAAEKTDEEKGIAGEEEAEEADKTSQTESAHGEAEKKKDEEVEEVGQKKLKDRVTEFVAKFKKTSEKKEEVKEVVEEEVKDEEKMKEIEPEDKEEKKE